MQTSRGAQIKAFTFFIARADCDADAVPTWTGVCMVKCSIVNIFENSCCLLGGYLVSTRRVKDKRPPPIEMACHCLSQWCNEATYSLAILLYGEAIFSRL
jgi:hypothetical protein